MSPPLADFLLLAGDVGRRVDGGDIDGLQRGDPFTPTQQRHDSDDDSGEAMAGLFHGAGGTADACAANRTAGRTSSPM